MEISFVWQLAAIALICEFVDSSLGMGYGTALTPLLLLMGYTPMQIVPSVLLSEFLTGTLAGVLHHELGNVDLTPGTQAFKTVIILAACSLVGTVAAVFIAVSIPTWILKTYIGVLVLSMGILILLTMKKSYPFSWAKVVGLGLLAAVNKGLSGGGYGPLVTSGQILSGVDGKSAIGITSVAEGLVCLVGIIAYLLTGSGTVDWQIAPSLALGALMSVPLAAITVKRLPLNSMKWCIGLATTLLGAVTLGKVIF